MNNTKLKKIKNKIKNNDELAFRLKVLTLKISDFLLKIIPDKPYIKLQYKIKTGRKLNLESPQLYNEKIQWLKLYYRKPILNTCVDKLVVREFVKSKIDKAEDILIPVIGVYNSVEDIDFDILPNSFILKLTNGSSFNYICLDKKPTEINKIRKRFNKWIDLNYYSIGREWAYKDVKNRIICEELLLTSSGNPPEDYRFFCFNGEVKLIAIDLESVVDGVKNSNYYRNLYDKDWQLIDGIIEYPKKSDRIINKPSRLQEMIDIAEELSSDFPAVRVDFYYFDNKFYFGELTFYHASGYQNIQPYDLEKRMGDWMNINK